MGNTTYAVPSRLHLLLTHENVSVTDTFVEGDEITLYALVRSLRSFVSPTYSDLNVFRSDTLFEDAKVVDFKSSVSGASYVLPGVNRSTAGHDIEENILSNSYYIVVPSRNQWSENSVV